MITNKRKMNELVKKFAENCYEIYELKDDEYDYSFDIIKKSELCYHLNNLVIFYGENGVINHERIILVPSDIF